MSQAGIKVRPTTYGIQSLLSGVQRRKYVHSTFGPATRGEQANGPFQGHQLST